jgi:membrane protein DedA with SNARE-associated domain
MNVSRYILAATGSAVVWAGTWTGLGYLLSDAISAVATRLGGPLLMLTERALGWVSRI